MSYELRPYQRDAIDAARARLAAGDRSTLLVLATGLGKMVIAADILRRTVEKGGRGIFLAHREELLEQCAEKLAALGVDGRIEQASRRAGDAPVVIASVATLQRKRLEAIDPSAFATAIIDEAHRAPAASYQKILAKLTAARVIGMSATPYRLDGKPLGDTFASVAYRYDLRQAIADGWLAQIVARRIVVDAIDLTEVKVRAGDLAQDQLAEIMNRAKAVRGVVEPILSVVGDRKTIVFAVDVAHAHALSEVINANRAGAAAVIHGEMSRDDRKAVLHAYTYGALQFVVNVDVLTEGTDLPATACIVNARPTQSLARYVQGVGRGTRKAPGKVDCLVLDVTGKTGRHSLVGPEDCLAGDINAMVREEINRLLGDGERNVADAIDEATRTAEARGDELARLASIRFHAERIDPFVGRDNNGALPTWSRDRAAPHQLREIEKLGVQKPPETLGYHEAERLIHRLTTRRRMGLCTLAQARQIARYGMDPRTMSFERAQQLIVRLKDAKWQAWAIENEPEVVEARAKRGHVETVADVDLQWGAA